MKDGKSHDKPKVKTKLCHQTPCELKPQGRGLRVSRHKQFNPRVSHPRSRHSVREGRPTLGTLCTFHSLENDFQLSRRKESIYGAPPGLWSRLKIQISSGFSPTPSRNKLFHPFAPLVRGPRAGIRFLPSCHLSPEVTLETLLGHLSQSVSCSLRGLQPALVLRDSQ